MVGTCQEWTLADSQKTVFCGAIDGQRGTWRPRNRWRDNIDNDMETTGHNSVSSLKARRVPVGKTVSIWPPSRGDDYISKIIQSIDQSLHGNMLYLVS